MFLEAAVVGSLAVITLLDAYVIKKLCSTRSFQRVYKKQFDDNDDVVYYSPASSAYLL